MIHKRQTKPCFISALIIIDIDSQYPQISIALLYIIFFLPIKFFTDLIYFKNLKLFNMLVKYRQEDIFKISRLINIDFNK